MGRAVFSKLRPSGQKEGLSMALDTFRRHFAQTTQSGIFFDNASMGPVAPGWGVY